MENLKYLHLFDCYGALLTENQREVCELYYALDLSLTEIAEQKGVTKQGVSDTLRKSRELLDSYEEKLRFGETLSKTANALRELAHTHPELAGDLEKIAENISANGEEV